MSYPKNISPEALKLLDKNGFQNDHWGGGDFRKGTEVLTYEDLRDRFQLAGPDWSDHNINTDELNRRLGLLEKRIMIARHY